MGGPQAISWAEMQAWAAMGGLNPQPWEAAVLRKLDAAWRRAWAEGRKTDRAAKKVSD